MIQTPFLKLKSFFIKCKRVYTVTKKPKKEEFKAVVKVTGAGILIIGLLGFIINIAAQLVR